MPLLSFVLVVHDEQAYLVECILSLIADRGDDVEVIVVDDASTDHGPELLDTLAGHDGRVRVERLASRVGSGEARRRGYEAAGGEYVAFVRATDLAAPGAIDGLSDVLRREAPDVLLAHHTVADVLGRRRAGPHRALLNRVAQDGTVTLDRRPALADAAPGTTNVFRTDRLRAVGEVLTAGELAVTWTALVAAERIAAWPSVAYVRRERPNARRERTTPDAYEAVLAFLESHDGIPQERRDLIPPAMLRHGLGLLTGAGRERDELARRLAAMIESGRLPRSAGGGRAAQLRGQLLARGDLKALALLDESLAARGAVKARAAKAKRRATRLAGKAQTAERRAEYRLLRRKALDPDLAVFAAYWYRGYSCNPRAIYEKARELVPSLRGVWVVNADAVKTLPPGVEHVVDGTREYYDVMARATLFVNNVNWPNDIVKRPGTVHVMTHHGTPLKRMGLDLQDHPVTGRRMDFAALMRRCARWDFSISQNAFTTPIWERVYPTRYESLEVGYPRNDVLANADEDDVARIRGELEIEPGQTAVLYAPTHREYQSDYVPVLDLADVAERLGPDHVLLARLHYFDTADPLLRRLHKEGRLRDVAAHPSVEELCLAADVLVTDYSSIMFDYGVLDRPIVIHAPDWETYRAIRGTYFDLMKEPPGVVTRTEDELVEAIGTRAAWGEQARRDLADFRERFCSLDDGHAAERVVRRLWAEAAAAGQPEATLAR